MQDDAARVAEAERVARQLITVATLKGIIPNKPDPDNHIDTLKSIWVSVQADPEIGQGAAHLLGLVGLQDALIVLDRGITRDVWSK